MSPVPSTTEEPTTVVMMPAAPGRWVNVVCNRIEAAGDGEGICPFIKYRVPLIPTVLDLHSEALVKAYPAEGARKD